MGARALLGAAAILLAAIGLALAGWLGASAWRERKRDKSYALLFGSVSVGLTITNILNIIYQIQQFTGGT